MIVCGQWPHAKRHSEEGVGSQGVGERRTGVTGAGPASGVCRGHCCPDAVGIVSLAWTRRATHLLAQLRKVFSKISDHNGKFYSHVLTEGGVSQVFLCAVRVNYKEGQRSGCGG